MVCTYVPIYPCTHVVMVFVIASTQTTLSIPLDFDLEKVLGSALYGFDQDTSFNLRRKLFGEPTRQDDTDEDNDGCHDNSPFDESSNETSQDTQ